MIDTISLERFEELFKQLESAFSARIPKVRLQLLWEALKGHTDHQVKTGLSYLINHKTHLPINHDIIMSCRIEREREWDSKKKEENKQAGDFRDPSKQKPGLARDATICINNVIEAKTKEEKAELMMEMETKYPGIGYKENARRL